MKMGRDGGAGSEQPVVADDDGTFSARPITEEIDGTFLERDGIEQVRTALERGVLDPVEMTNARGDVTANSDDMWVEVFDVNVFGIVRASRAALPLLVDSPCAAIVNVGSIAGSAGLPQRALSSATKGAVHALTLAIAVGRGQRARDWNSCAGSPRARPPRLRTAPASGSAARADSVRLPDAVVTYRVVRSGPPNVHDVGRDTGNGT